MVLSGCPTAPAAGLAEFLSDGVAEGAEGTAFMIPFAGAGLLPDVEVGLAGGAPPRGASFDPFAPRGSGLPLPAPAVGGPTYFSD